jgi:hypothetical protein
VRRRRLLATGAKERAAAATWRRPGVVVVGEEDDGELSAVVAAHAAVDEISKRVRRPADRAGGYRDLAIAGHYLEFPTGPYEASLRRAGC